AVKKWDQIKTDSGHILPGKTVEAEAITPMLSLTETAKSNAQDKELHNKLSALEDRKDTMDTELSMSPMLNASQHPNFTEGEVAEWGSDSNTARRKKRADTYLKLDIAMTKLREQIADNSGVLSKTRTAAVAKDMPDDTISRSVVGQISKKVADAINNKDHNNVLRYYGLEIPQFRNETEAEANAQSNEYTETQHAHLTELGLSRSALLEATFSYADIMDAIHKKVSDKQDKLKEKDVGIFDPGAQVEYRNDDGTGDAQQTETAAQIGYALGDDGVSKPSYDKSLKKALENEADNPTEGAKTDDRSTVGVAYNERELNEQLLTVKNDIDILERELYAEKIAMEGQKNFPDEYSDKPVDEVLHAKKTQYLPVLKQRQEEIEDKLYTVADAPMEAMVQRARSEEAEMTNSMDAAIKANVKYNSKYKKLERSIEQRREAIAVNERRIEQAKKRNNATTAKAIENAEKAIAAYEDDIARAQQQINTLPEVERIDLQKKKSVVHLKETEAAREKLRRDENIGDPKDWKPTGKTGDVISKGTKSAESAESAESAKPVTTYADKNNGAMIRKTAMFGGETIPLAYVLKPKGIEHALLAHKAPGTDRWMVSVPGLDVTLVANMDTKKQAIQEAMRRIDDAGVDRVNQLIQEARDAGKKPNEVSDLFAIPTETKTEKEPLIRDGVIFTAGIHSSPGNKGEVYTNVAYCYGCAENTVKALTKKGYASVEAYITQKDFSGKTDKLGDHQVAITDINGTRYIVDHPQRDFFKPLSPPIANKGIIQSDKFIPRFIEASLHNMTKHYGLVQTPSTKKLNRLAIKKGLTRKSDAQAALDGILQTTIPTEAQSKKRGNVSQSDNKTPRGFNINVDKTLVNSTQALADKMLKGTGIKAKIVDGLDAEKVAERLGIEDYKLGMAYGGLHGFAENVPNKDGSYNVYINPAMQGKLREEIIAHEIGHVTMYGSVMEADTSAKEAQAVLNQFGNWLNKYGKDDTFYRELVASKKSPESALLYLKSGLGEYHMGSLGEETSGYMKDFDEWYADEAGKALLRKVRNQSPRGFVEKYFGKLVELLRKVFKQTTAVEKFLQQISNQTTPARFTTDTLYATSYPPLPPKLKSAQSKLNKAVSKQYNASMLQLAKDFVLDKDWNLRNFDIPSLTKLADLMHKQRGDQTVDNSYWSAKLTHMAKYDEHVTTIMRGSTKEQQRQIMSELYNEKLTDSQVSGRTKRIRSLFRDLQDYMESAGIDINARKNYFPEIADVEYVEKHEKEFKAMMAKYTKEMKGIAEKWNENIKKRDHHLGRVTNPESLLKAEDVPQAIYDNIVKTEGVFDEAAVGQQTPNVRFLNHRIISFLEGRDKFEWETNYLQSSVTDATATYITQAVKRVEYEKRFGHLGVMEQQQYVSYLMDRLGRYEYSVEEIEKFEYEAKLTNKLEWLLKEAQDEGATARQIQKARTYLAAEMGTLGRHTAMWLNEHLSIPMPPAHSPINENLQQLSSTIMSVANVWVL
ncbi:MAG: hypothetical protein DRQ47_04765, partial [Gammaproteobacteria bacterium]